MNTTSQSHAFFGEFRSRIAEIRNQLEKAAAETELDALRQQLSELESAVREATIYLPPYDQKLYTKGIREVYDEMGAKQAQLKPRTKFSFNKRNKPKPVANSNDSLDKSQKDSIVKLPAEEKTVDQSVRGLLIARIDQASYRFNRENLSHTEQELPISTGVDIQIQDCQDAVIDLTSSELMISALHLARLTNCVLLCRPIAGSALITDLKNCILCIACHQFRMHDSERVWSHLHVTSHPIIEQCNQVYFGKYTLPLDGLSDMLKAAQLDPAVNQFDLVDDFNWLKKQKSPHWSTIPDEQLITSEQWETVNHIGDQGVVDAIHALLPKT